MLGALRCTPVCILEAEADIIPLETRRKQLLTQFICRTTGINKHPIGTLIQQYNPIQDLFDHGIPLPAIGRAYDELRQLQISPNNIAPFPTEQKYLFLETPAFCSLAISIKSQFSEEQWVQLFKDLLSRYPSHTPSTVMAHCEKEQRAVECGAQTSSSCAVSQQELQSSQQS
jgi:hypothetical protein